MGKPGYVCSVPVYTMHELTMFCDLEDSLRGELESSFGFSENAAKEAAKEAVTVIMSRGRFEQDSRGETKWVEDVPEGTYLDGVLD